MPKRQNTPCTQDAVRLLCSEHGFRLTGKELEDLAHYLLLLGKWNKVMNLVGPASWREVLSLLVADSFHLVPFIKNLPLAPEPICRDLGSGAGLPGLPLRMLWQQGTYALVEAREKRALFMRTYLAARPLPGTSVHQDRAERFMTRNAPAHLTISRAFMPWRSVLDLIGPYTEPEGFCVFLTLAPLPDTMPPGWTAVAEKQYIAGTDARFFWALRKV